MNQSMRNSGGMSAARHRSGRVFRRSLTPTLALLAAMALGLVVPASAAAQLYPLVIQGNGGGGGGGGAGSLTPGAGGYDGNGSSANQGAPGTNTEGGAGGSGTGNGGTPGGPPIGPLGGRGGQGADRIVNEVTSNTYTGVIIRGGNGGRNGTAGAPTPAGPGNTPPAGISGAGGTGGAGGNLFFNGATDVITTITGNLDVRGGHEGTGYGLGGMALVNYQGTMRFDGTGAHSLIFSDEDYGYVDVFINNLLIDNSVATIYAGSTSVDSDPGIDTDIVSLSGNTIIRFNTLSLNSATFQVANDSQYVLPTEMSDSGFTFNNLYVSGQNNRFNLDPNAAATDAYNPGNLHVNGKLIFEVGNNITNSSTMLTAGAIAGGTASSINLSGLGLDGVQIVSNGSGYFSNLSAGQTITLIQNVDGAGAYVGGVITNVHKGGLRFEDFAIKTVTGGTTDLVATFNGLNPSVANGKAFTPYFQGQMAAMHIVSGASRPILDESIRALANTTTNVGVPLINLSAIGSSTKLNTGSDAEMESFGGLLSVGAKMGNNSGVSTVAAFGEFGTGSYDTFTEITDLRSFNGGRFIGSGDADYAGGGVFVHHLFDATRFAGGLSVEGSFRLGTVKNQFNMDMLDRSGYDISRRYWGGHVGAGYNMPLNNLNSVDFFGQLHLTNVESGDFRSTANEAITFDSAQSTVSRIGGRYNHNINELFKAYATAAWEYEFDGETGGSVDGIKIQDPASIKGSSGFGQLGMNVKSANNPVSLDLSVFGVIGQQEGYGGTVGLKLDF